MSLMMSSLVVMVLDIGQTKHHRAIIHRTYTYRHCQRLHMFDICMIKSNSTLNFIGIDYT